MNSSKDPTCVLLPPSRIMQLQSDVAGRIEAALALRLEVSRADVKQSKIISRTIRVWGKVRILNEGDTINAAAITRVGEDSRDASFVRVSMYSILT